MQRQLHFRETPTLTYPCIEDVSLLHVMFIDASHASHRLRENHMHQLLDPESLDSKPLSPNPKYLKRSSIKTEPLIPQILKLKSLEELEAQRDLFQSFDDTHSGVLKKALEFRV